MKRQIHRLGEFIGDIRFPVDKRRFSDIPLWPIFIKGYGLTVLIIIGIRCLFFINADFADAVVKSHSYRHEGRRTLIIPMVAFKTKEGREIYFKANRDLYLQEGDHVRVIYKVHHPDRALVFSFAGFWANAFVICLIFLLFWIGFPLAYFGFDD